MSILPVGLHGRVLLGSKPARFQNASSVLRFISKLVAIDYDFGNPGNPADIAKVVVNAYKTDQHKFSYD